MTIMPKRFIYKRYESLVSEFKATAYAYGYNLSDKKYQLHIENDPNTYTCNVASLGPQEAKNVVVVTSGVHGIELPYGSIAQQNWMKAAEETVASSHGKIRFVFVHALNPYGAAHALRTDQDNIDVNRNFLSYFNPNLAPKYYKELRSAFMPKGTNIQNYMRSYAKIMSFIAKRGTSNFVDAFAGGQCIDEKGHYYTGRLPSWSHNTWKQIIAEEVINPKTENVFHCDLHTGVGDYGHVTVLINSDGKSETDKLLAQDPVLANHIVNTGNAFTEITGDIVDFWGEIPKPKGCKVYPFCFEVGVTKLEPLGLAEMDVMHAIISRNTMRNIHQDDHRKAIKVILRAAETFYPNDEAWFNSANAQTSQLANSINRIAPRL